MDKRRVAGQTGILALTTVVLLALWGCPAATEPEPEVQPQPEQPSPSSQERGNELLMENFDKLESIAGTGQVLLRITPQGPSKQSASACDRRIMVQTFGPTIYWEPNFSPIQVKWLVAQSPFGTWMSGDRIHIERKQPSDDPCFALEPFDINHPALFVESDQPLQDCRMEGPWPVFWLYKATLYNTDCEGAVDETDPLVIIKPRP
jgi:hypothetical protein